MSPIAHVVGFARGRIFHLAEAAAHVADLFVKRGLVDLNHRHGNAQVPVQFNIEGGRNAHLIVEVEFTRLVPVVGVGEILLGQRLAQHTKAVTLNVLLDALADKALHFVHQNGFAHAFLDRGHGRLARAKAGQHGSAALFFELGFHTG